MKMQKNLKTISSYTESTDLILKAFKKLFISWHCPFKVGLVLRYDQDPDPVRDQNKKPDPDLVDRYPQHFFFTTINLFKFS